MFVNCKAYLGKVSFFPQSEADKVDTFSFSKNTFEIALLDCGTSRYQTAAGTGPPYVVQTKVWRQMHTFSVCLFPSAYHSIPALPGCFCIVFVFKLICLPDDLSFSVWASILSLSHLLPLLILTPTLRFESERNKLTSRHTVTHCASLHTQKLHSHTHATREQQVILTLSTGHLVTLI